MKIKLITVAFLTRVYFKTLDHLFIEFVIPCQKPLRLMIIMAAPFLHPPIFPPEACHLNLFAGRSSLVLTGMEFAIFSSSPPSFLLLFKLLWCKSTSVCKMSIWLLLLIKTFVSDFLFLKMSIWNWGRRERWEDRERRAFLGVNLWDDSIPEKRGKILLFQNQGLA